MELLTRHKVQQRVSKLTQADVDVAIDVYNNRVNRATGRRPNSVTRGSEAEAEAYRRSTTDKWTSRRPQRFQFSRGDRVRLLRKEGGGPFAKGYAFKMNRLTVYRVSGLVGGRPVRYKLSDSGGRPVAGLFYGYELFKVPEDKPAALARVFRVDRILARKTVNGQDRVRVTFRGLPRHYQAWLALEDL